MNPGRFLFLSCLILMLSFPTARVRPQAPKGGVDLIFVHGNVYTGLALSSSVPAIKRVQAIAIKGERIQEVGPDQDVLRLKGPHTEVVDLGGHFVMPGFNDAHVHLASGGFERLTLALVGSKSLDDFRERIRAGAEKAAPGEWVIGRGWDETLWPMKIVPTRRDVDKVTGDHPAFLERVDGHVAVANTRALQLAGITLASQDPANGKIDRDRAGEPTGILRETAVGIVFSVIPKPDHAKRRQAIEAALRDVAQSGITSVQDNSSWEDFQIYEELEREGKLTARISEWLPFNAPLDELAAKRKQHPLGDNMLRTGMLKGFMDGSLGSHTAALLEPYADDPKNCGLPQYEQAKLTEMAEARALAGYQLGFHAIGDKGVQMALDAFAEAQKAAREKKVKGPNGSADYRLRIEHAQVTTPAQIERFRQLKVIASMQPSHLLTDMNWAMARLGPARAANSYAWADFLKNGVTLAFGTDYPVEPVAPFRGLYAAVTRKDVAFKSDYFPRERLTMDQAIAAYTTGSAFAEFSEKEKGVLRPGMLADLVVLDRDISAVSAKEVLETKVLRTVVGGKTVYETK